LKGKFFLQIDYNILHGKNQHNLLNILQSFWDNKSVIRKNTRNRRNVPCQRTTIMRAKIPATTILTLTTATTLTTTATTTPITAIAIPTTAILIPTTTAMAMSHLKTSLLRIRTAILITLTTKLLTTKTTATVPDINF
jgi:hypothetical protein